ncbi:MAG: Na(+)/H(+) antiporter subunit C [Ruaniaceae bacterium]|nr:Na(+)/H(+) antiporter subunit C [Ruaniaceae bacterium]
MNSSLILVILAALLVGVGVYLLLERSLSRIVIGVAMAGNGINVLFLVAGGPPGAAPLYVDGELVSYSDPLPQAMVLTAIVITLGMTAFVLAMAYRAWQLNGHDEVQDDLEDRRLAQRAARDAVDARATDDDGSTLDDEARAAIDEIFDEDANAASPDPTGPAAEGRAP